MYNRKPCIHRLVSDVTLTFLLLLHCNVTVASAYKVSIIQLVTQHMQFGWYKVDQSSQRTIQ